MNKIRFSLPVFVGTAVFAASCWAQQASKEPSKSPVSQKPAKSLDEQFFDDIGPATPQKGPAQDPSSTGPVSEKSRESDGRVVELSPNDVEQKNPLLALGNRMRRVEQRLSERDVSEVTQATQRQIVADLDKLIDELASQQSSNQQQRQVGEGKQGDQESQTTGNQAATESGKPPGDAQKVDEVTAAMRRTLGEFWGHLPERVRRQMQNARAVEFLPQYRKLIEDYYTRLAEERGNSP